MRAHIIENGRVTNTILVDSLDDIPGVTLAEPIGSSDIGDLWDGTAFSKPLPDPATVKAAIQAQIDALERASMLNRGSRELELRLMENEAVSLAESRGVTVADVLASVPYYGKLKALDDSVTALRAQL